MKIFRFMGRVAKPFVDVPTWVGYKQLAETTSSIGRAIKSLFVLPKESVQTETFEQAMARLNLTEADIANRKKEFTRLLIFSLVVAAALFGYSIYLMWVQSIHGSLATFSLMLVASAIAFRYHFWLFQIKQRRLGCTFREWLNTSFTGEK